MDLDGFEREHNHNAENHDSTKGDESGSIKEDEEIIETMRHHRRHKRGEHEGLSIACELCQAHEVAHQYGVGGVSRDGCEHAT